MLIEFDWLLNPPEPPNPKLAVGRTSIDPFDIVVVCIPDSPLCAPFKGLGNAPDGADEPVFELAIFPEAMFEFDGCPPPFTLELVLTPLPPVVGPIFPLLPPPP
jgi:hypothetical protein